MLEKILKAIEKNKIETYLINKREIEGAELYFIKKDLDMRRMKKNSSCEVTVYRDFEEEGAKMRGFSMIHVFPEMEEEEIEKAIAGAYYAASFVKNPYFELPKGKKQDLVKAKSGLSGKTLEEISDTFVTALYKADCNEEAFINTSEFFVSKETVSIVNSEGTDVSYEKEKVTGEFVVQCLSPQDVEQYQDFSYVDLDTDALTIQAKEALEMVCARAKAKTAPKKGTYNVIISGKEVDQLLAMYVDRANVGRIYPGYSNYKEGMMVQGEDVTGGSINGNLLKLQNDMIFTTDRYRNDHYNGPMAVKLKNVTVAGA